MKNKGQIAIITLFSLAVFVVIGGSIVTQIIFEQRKAALEEKSRQAYYAAESGIESALQEILDDGTLDSSTLTLGNANVGITSTTIGGGPTYVVPNLLYSGESTYLSLEGYTDNQLRVCWDKAGTSIIASYFYDAGGVLRTNTYAINSESSTNIPNAFASASGTDLCGLTGPVYYYDLNFPVGSTPKYLQIWVTYQQQVALGFQAFGTATIGEQYTIITSLAEVEETEGQVAREIKYSVSRTSTGTLTYPPAWLTVPIYAVGGVIYKTE